MVPQLTRAGVKKPSAVSVDCKATLTMRECGPGTAANMKVLGRCFSHFRMCQEWGGLSSGGLGVTGILLLGLVSEKFTCSYSKTEKQLDTGNEGTQFACCGSQNPLLCSVGSTGSLDMSSSAMSWYRSCSFSLTFSSMERILNGCRHSHAQ